MVDARGGAMRGCRHSGVRVIIPPRKAAMPTRITCRYLKKEKLNNPPSLMEGEACASRILEMGPAGAKFLGPVIIEVPHFASLRGKEREITILRSDNGETWREHTLEATEEAVQDVLNESFDGEELNALEDLNTNRITRILTTDFPKYFAIVSRVRQEVHAIGPEGGMVSSTVVPQVQAVFPEGALTKKIKVGLQAQPIPAELVAKMLGNRVAVSPIVTVEPRRRKFHKPIVLTIPVPQAASKGMLNQYSGDAPTLRLLCSITGGTTRAQWEDVTGSTPLTFVNDCVSFTTTVSARFWLMDCRNISEASKMATELYREAIHVPFMAKFVVFAKRHDPQEARLRVFCMTDDKEEKTLENQEHFVEVAKSRDVEVLESKPQFVEFAGNLVPVTKSGEQLCLVFHAFKENRLPFVVRVRDPHQDPAGRIAFMREAKVSRGEPPQTPICNLNITLPDIAKGDSPHDADLLSIEKRYDYLTDVGINKEAIHRAELRLSDIANLLGKDWTMLALQLDIEESDINVIKSEYPDDVVQQAIVMLRLWVQLSGNKATGNTLEKALRKINREDIVNLCIFNVELVTDDVEKAVAKVHLDQSGFDTLKEELGPSREASLRRDTSLDASYDEQDIMKEAESAEETSSETGSIPERHIHIDPDVIESVADRPARQEAKIVHEIIKDSVPGSVPLHIETSAKPSSDYAPGDELEAARLAESETWTSQELDRSTPDLLHAGPDVLTHGHPGDKRSSWGEEEEEEEEQEEDKWDVKTDEWVEKDDDGFITKKVTKIQYSTKDEQDEKKAISEKAEESAASPATAESVMASGKQVSDEGVVEESIPFHQKKDFFQKLSSPPDGSLTSPPRKSSPPSPPADDRSRPDKPEAAGVDAEEMLSFSERLSGFRKLEEASLESREKQALRRSFAESETVTTTTRAPPTSTAEPRPPREDLPALVCVDASKLPEPGVSAKHEETQRVFEGSLDLIHGIPRTDTGEDFNITTPDLETPIEGPEAASKSNNQKMIEVTERVAEVAFTLASTLEQVERSAGKPLPDNSRECIPPKRPERTKKAAPAPTDRKQGPRAPPDREEADRSQAWEVVDAEIQGAFLETEAMASDLDQAGIEAEMIQKRAKAIADESSRQAEPRTEAPKQAEPTVTETPKQSEAAVTEIQKKVGPMVTETQKQAKAIADESSRLAEPRTETPKQAELIVTETQKQAEPIVIETQKQAKAIVDESSRQAEPRTETPKQAEPIVVETQKQAKAIVDESSRQAALTATETQKQAEPMVPETKKLAERILEESKRQAEPISDEGRRPITPESPRRTPQPSTLEYQAVSIAQDEGRAVKAEIKLLVKTSEMGRDAIEIRSIKEFVELDKTEGKKSELSRIFSEAAASDVSPPISKMDVDDGSILPRPPSGADAPPGAGEPKRPLSPVQPCLGSLSIAYEEPPRYRSPDVEADSSKESVQETIPDIMRHLSDKVSPADQQALAEDTDVEDQFTSVSPPHDSHMRPPSLTETVLNKLSPLEPTSDMGEVEQELSPAVEFPQRLTPQTQVYVGVSPTEGLATYLTSLDGSEDLQKPPPMPETVRHDPDTMTAFEDERQVSGVVRQDFPPPVPHPQFQPSAPPQPPEDMDGLIAPEMVSSEMSDRSDTESTQTSAATVIYKPEPDLLSSFRGDGTSSSSLTGLSDREESLDLEVSFQAESLEGSQTFRHTIESASSAYSQRTESTESESELSGPQFAHLGFENKAFAGVEHIDEATAARKTSSSPFELPRDSSQEEVQDETTEAVQRSSEERVERTSLERVEKISVEGVEKMSLEGFEKTRLESLTKTTLEDIQKTSLEGFEKTSLEGFEKTSLEGFTKTSLEGFTKTSREDTKKSLEGFEKTSLEDIQKTSLEDIKKTSREDTKKSLEGFEKTSLEDIQKTYLEDIQKTSLQGVEKTSVQRVEKTSQEDFARASVEHFGKPPLEHVEKAALKEQELSFKKEIFKKGLQADDEEHATLERKRLPFDEPKETRSPVLDEAEKQERIDQQIKSEIFSHELDEAIEAEPPEVTYLSGSSSIDEKSEQFVARRMKSDIFSQELAQALDDQSPEQKDLPKFPDLVAEPEALPLVTPTRSASENPAETVLWEVPVQEQTVPDTLETTEEIPAHRQVIVERDEDEDEESEPDTANIEDVERDMLTAEEAREIAEGIVEDIKTEVGRRPPLRHIPSEISEEDLVERYGGSPEQELALGRQTRFLTTEASSIDITDEELQASSDELSPVEQHRERLESMTIEENLRRQSFVQLSEEHDLLAETEWKASKWKDAEEERDDDKAKGAETFRLLETSPLVDEILSKGFAGTRSSPAASKVEASEAEEKERFAKAGEKERVSAEEKEHYVKAEVKEHVKAEEKEHVKAEEKEHYVKAEGKEHDVKAEEKEHYVKAEEKQHDVKAEEKEHYVKAEEKEHVKAEEKEHVKAQEKEHVKAEEKERHVKAEEKEHVKAEGIKEHYVKAEEKEHYVKAEGKEHYVKAEGKEHDVKAEEKEHYVKTEDDREFARFAEKEETHSISREEAELRQEQSAKSALKEQFEETWQATESGKERSVQFGQEKHSTGVEESRHSAKSEKEQSVKLEEKREHSSSFEESRQSVTLGKDVVTEKEQAVKSVKSEQSVEERKEEHSSSFEERRQTATTAKEQVVKSEAKEQEQETQRSVTSEEKQRYAEFDKKEQSATFDRKEQSATFDKKEQRAAFDEKEHYSKSDEKEQYSKSDAKEHYSKVDEKEQYSKSDAKEHYSKLDEKEQYSKSDAKEHYSKVDEKEQYSKSDAKEHYSKSDAKEHFSKSDEKEQYSKSDEKEQYSKSDEKEQYSKSDEKEHYSKSDEQEHGSKFEEHDRYAKFAEEAPFFREHAFAEEMSPLEKDRERRAKQEQEFQEVVKLRREQVEQARSREASQPEAETEKPEQAEGFSSSGESHYSSAVESDSSGQTSRGTPAASRPCSSDVETLVLSGPGSSEYDTCATSEDGTYRTAPTSQEYVTAGSSLSHSSRESMRSIDSESSGHLGSVEVSSEASETLVPSAVELERDTETPTIDDERFFAPEPPVREPYETEIPEHVIRGEPAGLRSEESADSTSTVLAADDDWEAGAEPGSPFEVILESEVAGLKGSAHPDVVGIEEADGQRGFLGEDGARGAMYRQESGAYLAGECVDDLPDQGSACAGAATVLFADPQGAASRDYYGPRPALFDEIPAMPVASAPPAEEDEDRAGAPAYLPDIYSQANGPVEVEFFPEYDAGPDDGYVAEAAAAAEAVCAGRPQPDIVPVRAFAAQRSDGSDEELSDAESEQDGQDARGSSFRGPEDAPYAYGHEEEMTCAGAVKGLPLDADRPESELRDLDLSSRPQSHAESDSEQRPFSELQFSDDRPDSELTELMKQADASEEKEAAEEMERPPSPEPLDEYDIREDFEGRKSAEAAAAAPLYRGEFPEGFPPDPECEKHEFETSEWSAKEKGAAAAMGIDIPDITVTQHVTPMVDQHYPYPDYEEEEAAACGPPDSESSSDSFEMVEKSDVGLDEDEAPPTYSSVSVKPLGVHYYPDEDGAEEADEAPPEEGGSYEKGEFEAQEKGAAGGEESPPRQEAELDAEKWMELQFEGAPAAEATSSGYLYQMDFEREYDERAEFYPRDEELEDIAEEGEKQDEEEDEKAEAGRPKESVSSTPDYDFLAGRRFFSRSGENDDVSMSSLQEFERIEAELARGDRRLSAGSQESLSNGRRRGDDASVTSLQEFERLERECADAERIERLAREEAARLSEIEEGHESQASEAESQETLSEHGGDDTDSDDYEKRMFEIDEIIKQAQSNVEQFVAGAEPEEAPKEERSKVDSSSVGSGDATESSLVDKTPSPGDDDSLDGDAEPPVRDGASSERAREGDRDDCDSDSLQEEAVGAAGLEFDRDSLGGGAPKACRRGGADTMASSTDSLEPSSSTATHATYQYETDSIMSSSFTSMQTSGEESTMVSSTDNFDLEQRLGGPAGSPPEPRFDDRPVFIEEALRQQQFVDAEGNVQTERPAFQRATRGITDTEGNLQTFGRDEPFSRTIHRSVMLEPEVRTVTFAGPDAETKMKEFIARFQPGDDVVEMETTDAMGNVHVTRTVQHRVIMQPRMTTVSFTGPEAERKIQEYLSQASAEMPDFGGAFVEGLGPEEAETETFETRDELGNVRRVVRKKSTPPSVDTVAFSGPDAQRDMEDFLKQTIAGFEPGQVAEEMTTRDQQGNAMKVVKHVVSTAVAEKRSTATDVPAPRKSVTKTVTVTALPDFGSPRKSPLLRESPPSSPTVSSSSHSEDCYCGPEAESSAYSASVGPHRPEIEELETESWDPQRRAEFYSEEGDYGVEEEDEELPPATATATRIVTHEVRRTVRGPNGEDIVVVETDDSYEDLPNIEQLRQQLQAASKQIVEVEEEVDPPHHRHQDS